MEKTTTVVPFRQVDSVDDPLTEIAREGARRMLAVAMGVEADAFVAQHSGVALPDGRQRVVRHGHGPMRRIQTGVGPLEVQRPKVRDRADVPEAEKIRFTSVILPRWARRSKSLDALLPVLYLRGISTGDFQEALAGLLGKDAPNLSPSVIGRLTAAWEGEYDAWRRRDLSARRYVYIWADGVYLQARMEPIAECMLVVIGATPEGKKELVGFQVGARESAQSWRELLVDLKARGLAVAPELAVGDGALGFWKALEEVFPSTRHQRCWVHKVVNVLNAVPNSMALQVKRDLNEITRAPDRAAATLALDTFVQKYGAKYEKAVACLERDRDALLAFFDFPAEHWDHLRTANPIESVFATVRHRTVRTKGALSQHTALLMVFKLLMAASRTWRRLK
jgi:putative transposase